jgi:hypothetical protein
VKSRSGKSFGAASVHAKSSMVSHCATILTHMDVPLEDLRAATKREFQQSRRHPQPTHPSAESQSVSTMAM